MVLKSVIRYVINRYLKNYIERLDDEKLNIDLRNGSSPFSSLHLFIVISDFRKCSIRKSSFKTRSSGTFHISSSSFPIIRIERSLF